MNDDLIERLRKQDMRQRSGGYFVFNGIMAEAATALSEARAEIERLRGENCDEPALTCPHIDKLLAGSDISAEVRDELETIRKINSQLRWSLWHERERSLIAESELSTLRAELDVANANHRQMAMTMADLARKHDALRARVREVVGPFAKAGDLFGSSQPESYDEDIYTPAAGDEYSLRGSHLRAARQLNEDLK